MNIFETKVPVLYIPGRTPTVAAIYGWGDTELAYVPRQWEIDYLQRRYLRGLADEELARRHCDVVRNLAVFVRPSGDQIPMQSPASSWYWLRKEHQTRLEALLRGKALTVPDRSILVSLGARGGLPAPDSVLFRYGAREHIDNLRERGRFLIRPASQFKAMDGDDVRQDDELSKSSFHLPENISVSTADGCPLKLASPVTRTGSTPEYLLYCVSTEWDEELFGAFGDACGVINEPDIFLARVKRAVADHDLPMDVHWIPVEYYDPCETWFGVQMHAGMHKDFRLAYQRESRFIFLPRDESLVRNPLFVEAGSMRDIVTIRQKPNSGDKRAEAI